MLTPVPVPVGHSASISPLGVTADALIDEAQELSDSIGLDCTVRRVLKLRIDERHDQLLDEYPNHPESRIADRFADISSLNGKRFRSLLPLQVVMETTVSELLKVHLMFKAVVQSGLSHSVLFFPAATGNSTHAVIEIDTVSNAKTYAFVSADFLYVVCDNQHHQRQFSTLERVFRRVGNVDAQWLAKSDSRNSSDHVRNWITPAGLVDYASIKVPQHTAPKGKDGKKGGLGKDQPPMYDGKKGGPGKHQPPMHAPWNPHGKGWYDHPYGLPYSGKDWLEKGEPWHFVEPDFGKGKFKGFWHDPAHFMDKGKQPGFAFGVGKGKGPNVATTNPSPQPSIWAPNPATTHEGPPRAILIQTAGAEHLESENVFDRTDGSFMSCDILDCLDIPDPGKDGRARRDETGLDQTLQAKLLAQDGFLNILEQGRQMLEARGQIFVFCRHGFHRSVGCGEILAAEMRAKGFSVEVTHHTLHKHSERFKGKGKGKSKDVRTPKLSKEELQEIIFGFGHNLDVRALQPGVGDLAASDEEYEPPESEDESWVQAVLDDKDRELDALTVAKDREIAELQERVNVLESQAPARPASTVLPAPRKANGVSRPIQPSQIDSVEDRTRKKAADEQLALILRDRRFEYMRDFHVYSDSKGMYLCKMCMNWDQATQTKVPCKPVTPEHLQSWDHLNIMSRHYFMNKDKQRSDDFMNLARDSKRRKF